MTGFGLLEWSEAIRNFALIAASLVGMCVAIIGLNTWRRERTWDRNERLAGAVLRAAYGYRTALRVYRSPFVENPNYGDADFDETIEDEQLRVTAALIGHFNSRLFPVRRRADDLADAINEAQFYWRDELPDVFKTIFNEMNHTEQYLLQVFLLKNMKPSPERIAYERLLASQQGLLESSAEQGQGRLKLLDEHVSQIENYLRAKMRRSS